MTRPDNPVLIVNPRSGGGKAIRFDLVAQCRARGIEPIVFEPGADLSALAAAAVRNGADALGMAGGDGSQAAVAAVAAEHDLPFVCVPAGTRSHFAFDLGIDRRDVVRSLDAFADGVERRIDLGRVNGRVFVNNVAMGFYGAVVQSPEYRDHKIRTMIERLPSLIGSNAEPFDLRFRGPRGGAHRGAALLLVSNNRYDVEARPGRGTRGALQSGMLGVLALAGPPPSGRLEWSAPTFRVESATTVLAGIDGESVEIEPPLEFESVPQSLRVRVAARPSRRRPVPVQARPAKRRSARPVDQDG